MSWCDISLWNLGFQMAQHRAVQKRLGGLGHYSCKPPTNGVRRACSKTRARNCSGASPRQKPSSARGYIRHRGRGMARHKARQTVSAPCLTSGEFYVARRAGIDLHGYGRHQGADLQHRQRCRWNAEASSVRGVLICRSDYRCSYWIAASARFECS
jgi:hypothetical protein